MMIKNKDELFALTRTAAYAQFLFSQEPTAGHFMGHQQSLANRALDAVMLEVFHSMVYLFQAHPHIHSIRPRWSPEIDSDEEIHIRTLIEVQMKDASGNAGPVQVHGYDSFPSEMGEDTETFALLVESAEAVYPDLWSSFKNTGLATRKEAFTSPDDVVAVMHDDLEHFVSEFEQWALSQTTPAATANTRRPSL